MDHRHFEEGLRSLVYDSLAAVAAGRFSLREAGIAGPQDIEIEAPKEESHGDVSSNVAMRLAGASGMPPFELAGLISEQVNSRLAGSRINNELMKAEPKEPGFLNFWFSFQRLYSILEDVASKKSCYGAVDMGKGEKANIEFVSANPTGPLTIAHGRQAAFGDSLANILTFAGYRVTREYYLNDEGNQMVMLGKSVRARYLQSLGVDVPFPEDGYKGPYVSVIGQQLKARYKDRLERHDRHEFFTEYGCRWLTAGIKKDLERFGVVFDVWYSQKKLARSGKIRQALDILRAKGHIYDKEGAVWFGSTAFGDDKNRVVIKSTGEYTYLAPDIAYHLDKMRRGFGLLIDIWGPDHHGYAPRLKAAVKALGLKDRLLEVLIVQLSTLYRDGKAVQMSTRAGEFITLHELVEEVGKDAARYFFLRRKRDSHLDFDLGLAKSQSMENPVYYVQYAYARICSIIKYYRAGGRPAARPLLDKSLLSQPDEADIVKLLGRFPLVIELCAKKLEVFPIISYLEELASSFHSYYDKHRIVTDDVRLTEARLYLCDGVRTVLAGGLRLLGVDSPQSM